MNAPAKIEAQTRAKVRFDKRVNAQLHFKRAGERTYLAYQHTPHPFHITQPFAIEGDPQEMATLYLQSSAGGLYHDDDHHLSVEIGDAAAAHVTSQASTIVHAGHDGLTKVRVELSVGKNGWLEFCPDPVILFPTARVKSSVAAKIEPDSRLILFDAQLCHDPKSSGETFDYLDNEIRLEGANGDAFYIDRSFVHGTNWFAATDGMQCAGTLVVFEAKKSHLITTALETAITDLDPKLVYAGQTHLVTRSVVIVRLVAANGADLTRAMNTLWQAARRAMTGEVPMPRRK